MYGRDSKLINKILEEYVNCISQIYGRYLYKVILYGSYARGDYNSDSDIDIMILVDMNDSKIKENRNKLSDVTFDINFDNDILIMPIVQSKELYEHWVKAYPFYNNINNEGIELYAG